MEETIDQTNNRLKRYRNIFSNQSKNVQYGKGERNERFEWKVDELLLID